jgi:hypothetical protein
MESSEMPRRFAYFSAYLRDARKQAHRPVRHLRAVADLDAAADGRVLVARAKRVRLVHVPVARLRVRVQLRVAVVLRRNGRQVLRLQAEALVIFVAELAEQLREGELHALGLAFVPRRRAEEVAARRRVDRLHLLEAQHAGQVVAPRLDLGRRRQQRDAARRAGGFVPPGRQAPEDRVHLEEERAQVSLAAVALGREVADMATSISSGPMSVASSPPLTASRIIATKCLFSLVQFREKSVWNPPRM